MPSSVDPNQPPVIQTPHLNQIRSPPRPWIFRRIPALESLRSYSQLHFRRDLLAGLTVAAVAIPQAMAYASIFGMPVQYGLYTAIVMTGVGALLDSSRQLINGPTNAISIAMFSALAGLPDDVRVPAAIGMSFMIGLLQTGITLLRLGDLSRYISHAVIVGFTAGASVLLVMDQLKNALGLKALGGADDHFLYRFWLTMREGGPIHFPTLALTLATILLILAIRSVNRRNRWVIPELLIAIIAAGTIAWWLDLGSHGVKLVEKIPRSLPSFQFPTLDWGISNEILTSVLAIGLLGLLEAIAMAKSIAAITREKLDINQQCLSEGIANLAGSFFQCFPGSGSLTRSYINHQAGAATQWSGVICAGAVAVTVLAFAPMAQYIPRAALSAVLLVTATKMIDMKGLKYHLRATTFDGIIVVATALSAIFVSVEFCILIGTMLSFLMYLPRAARVELAELVRGDGGVIRERVEGDPECSRLKLYNFEGELFFGSSPEFESQLEQIEECLTAETKVIIIRIKHLRNPDAVCMDLLEKFIDRIESRKITVALSGVREDFYRILERSGIVARLGEEKIFRELSQVWSSTTTAMQWAYQKLGTDLCNHCPRRGIHPSEDGAWYFMI
jgi:sulfate permease, SulP family